MSNEPGIPLILCGVFYGGLCIFSLVTGLIYMSGRKELTPVELSDSLMERLSDPKKRRNFARKMGLVTFIVGIAQGLASMAILKSRTPFSYRFSLGFTVFSIVSVLIKLKNRVNAFPLAKLAAYSAILVILLLGSTRALFFHSAL